MKKLIVILVMILVLFACQKETEYVEVETAPMMGNFVKYHFVNKSGYALTVKGVFIIESDCLKKYETDCITINGYSNYSGRFEVGCEPYFVESKVIICR
jgi:hypothetical protein